MRKLIWLLFIFSNFISCDPLIAQDTITLTKNRVKVYELITAKPIHDTVIITVHDTIKVPCDTVVPTPQKDTIWRGIYINGTSSIAGNKVKEDALINDLNRWKFNATFGYSIDGANSSALAALYKRMRKETLVTEIGATASSSGTFNSTRKNWNLSQPDSSDYDSWNLEFEPWNATDKAAAFYTNYVYMKEMQAGKVAAQVDYVTDYFGWPLNAATYDSLAKFMDYQLFHCYRVAPEWSYLQTRITALNEAYKRAGKQGKWRVIFSAEPSFMQGYLNTHTLDQAYKVIYDAFTAMRYTNLKLDGYLVFHLDFLRASQPTTVARTINVSAPDFINVTTPAHLKTAIER